MRRSTSSSRARGAAALAFTLVGAFALGACSSDSTSTSATAATSTTVAPETVKVDDATVTAGFTKEMVRAASRQLGLRTWDKPAAACLASRIPYGTEVSVGLLSQVERAEAALKRINIEA